MPTTITLNPRAESLNEALGITDERHEQIVMALLRARKTMPHAFVYFDLIKSAIEQANPTSANEQFYVGTLIEKVLPCK